MRIIKRQEQVVYCILKKYLLQKTMNAGANIHPIKLILNAKIENGIKKGLTIRMSTPFSEAPPLGLEPRTP